METKLTTNAKGNEYVEYKMEDDPFFFCKYGYIFSAPEHNLYLKQCDLDLERPCKGCPKFEKKS